MDIQVVDIQDVMDHVDLMDGSSRVDLRFERVPRTSIACISFISGHTASVFYLDTNLGLERRWLALGSRVARAGEAATMKICFSWFDRDDDSAAVRQNTREFLVELVNCGDISEIKFNDIINDAGIFAFPLAKFGRSRDEDSVDKLCVSLDRDHGCITEECGLVVATAIMESQVSTVKLEHFSKHSLGALRRILVACKTGNVQTLELGEMKVLADHYVRELLFSTTIPRPPGPRLWEIKLSLDPSCVMSVRHARCFIRLMKYNTCITHLALRIPDRDAKTLRELRNMDLDHSIANLLCDKSSMHGLIYSSNHALTSVRVLDSNGANIPGASMCEDLYAPDQLSALLATNEDCVVNAVYKKAVYAMKHRNPYFSNEDVARTERGRKLLANAHLPFLDRDGLERLYITGLIEEQSTVASEIEGLPLSCLPNALLWRPMITEYYSMSSSRNAEEKCSKLSYMFEVLRNSSKEWAVTACQKVTQKPKRTKRPRDGVGEGGGNDMMDPREYRREVYFKVRRSFGKMQRYRMYSDQPFKTLAKAYSEHIGIDPLTVKLYYDGKALKQRDTPMSMGFTSSEYEFLASTD